MGDAGDLHVGDRPLGTAGLDPDPGSRGMDAENVKEFGWALAGEEVLAPTLEELLAKTEGTRWRPTRLTVLRAST